MSRYLSIRCDYCVFAFLLRLRLRLGLANDWTILL
jgi:hypothetical protein